MCINMVPKIFIFYALFIVSYKLRVEAQYVTTVRPPYGRGTTAYQRAGTVTTRAVGTPEAAVKTTLIGGQPVLKTNLNTELELVKALDPKILAAETDIFYCISRCLGIYFNPYPPKLTVTSAAPTVTAATARPVQCPLYTCLTDNKMVRTVKGKLKRYGTGTFKTCQKRQYFFSDDKLTHQKAKESCCKLSMKLAAFDTPDKIACILSLAKDDEKIQELELWSSGSQIGAPTLYVWCDAGTPFATPIPWAVYEPSNILASEFCVAVVIRNLIFQLNDFLCNLPRKYLCEAEN